MLDDGTEEPAYQRAALAPRVTGWRAACECGWRSPNLYSRAEWGRSDRPGRPAAELDGDGDGDDGILYREWQAHLDAALPELGVHEAAATHRTTGQLLDKAVALARADGVSWERIGAAAGITGRSARDRWRHLDPAAGERRS